MFLKKSSARDLKTIHNGYLKRPARPTSLFFFPTFRFPALFPICYYPHRAMTRHPVDMLFRVSVALLSVLYVISVFLASLTVKASPVPFVRPAVSTFLQRSVGSSLQVCDRCL
jgi:hypothetical protein